MQQDRHFTNAALLTRRHAAVARGVGQAHDLFIQKARNAELWDVEGRRFIDFAGGIAVLNTGHLHAGVIAAVKAQLELYTHTCFQVVAYEPYVEVCERLNTLAPGAFAKKSLLLTTGAEAVENAIKIARAYTKRPGVIAFTGGYHGRTNLTLGLTGKVAPYKIGFGPFPGEMYHALFPNALHGVSVEQALHSVELIFKNDIEPERVAAFILEPVQGEGGFYVAPPEFVTGLKALADRYGILLIADEVQTGAGRTGTWFGYQHYGIKPDFVTMAKGVASGYAAISCTVTTEAVFEMFKDDPSDPLSYFRDITTFGGAQQAIARGIAFLHHRRARRAHGDRTRRAVALAFHLDRAEGRILDRDRQFLGRGDEDVAAAGFAAGGFRMVVWGWHGGCPKKKRPGWAVFHGADDRRGNYRLWVKVRVTTSRCCSGVSALKRTA